VSPAGDSESVDVARVPEVLRDRLDARLVEHDGGAVALRAFLDAGAVAQLNLTLMKGRSVHEVIASSPRLSEPERSEVLSSWDGRARLFELRPEWAPIQAIEEEGGEALVVSLASGPASAPASTPNRCG